MKNDNESRELEFRLRREEEIATIRRSKDLDLIDCRRMERSLLLQPNDLATRLTLVGYYFVPSCSCRLLAKKRENHIVWLIENYPEHWILSEPWTDPRNARETRLMKERWIQKLKASPSNARAFEHAARAMWYYDFSTCEKWMLQAEKLEPERPEPFEYLCHQYWLKLVFEKSPAQRKRYALGVVQQGEGQMKVDDSDFFQKWQVLARMAYCALLIGDIRKARQYTSDYEKQCARFQHFTWRGPHFAQVMTALFALEAGDVDRAVDELLCVELSCNPTFELMRRLIKQGKSKDVIQFLKKKVIRKQLGDSRTKAWVERLKNGLTPKFQDDLVLSD